MSVTGLQQFLQVFKSNGAASDKGVTGRSVCVYQRLVPLPSMLQFLAEAAACLDTNVTAAKEPPFDRKSSLASFFMVRLLQHLRRGSETDLKNKRKLHETPEENPVGADPGLRAVSSS